MSATMEEVREAVKHVLELMASVSADIESVSASCNEIKQNTKVSEEINRLLASETATLNNNIKLLGRF